MFLSGVFRPRGGGKTWKLMTILEGNSDAVLVVNTSVQKQRCLRTLSHNINKNQVITLAQLQDGQVLRGRRVGVLLFDDFEHMLPQLLGSATPRVNAFVISATGSTL